MSLDYSTRESFTVRQPATALLCIDSADRVTAQWPNPYDFQIQKNQQTIPGLFTRIGVTEICMGYNTNNIYPGMRRIVFDISGDPGAPRTITVTDGMYTAYEALQAIVAELNDLSGTTGAGFQLHTPAVPNGWTLFNGLAYVISCNQDFEVLPAANDGLFEGLSFLTPSPGPMVTQGGTMPDIRRTRYVDIVCNQLTNCQYVKDTSTLAINRDLLARYYFASETPAYDAGGLVEYVGYTPFYIHRQWNVPKQIRFEPIQSIGSLRFTVYDDAGAILEPDDQDPPAQISKVNWNMTLQLSEN